LGQAQAGLKKYDEAEVTYKKLLMLRILQRSRILRFRAWQRAVSGKFTPAPASSRRKCGIRCRPPKSIQLKAGLYLKNEAVIFFQMNNGDAQVAAADEAIAADPNQPILYYLKGQGLIVKATLDPKTQKIVAPPGCLEAYQKYLQLAPDWSLCR
jgi:tetratricopeptide (TPR) repeat protein